MRVLLVPLAMLGIPVAAEAAAPAVVARPGDLRETLNVRYHPGAGNRHLLDVFAPRGRSVDRLPVVLFVHGGTWMIGDKNFFGMYRGVGRFLASQGVIAVMVNYRLSPLVRHPEHAQDVARAFAWTVRNVARYGGDPGRILLAGHSAGGHLVSLVASNPAYLTAPELKLGQKERAALCGVVSVSGVYRIPGPDEFHEMAASIVANLLGSTEKPGLKRLGTRILLGASPVLNPFYLVFGRDVAIQREASPLTHVQRGMPPFLLLYAAREVPGLTGMAEDFAGALRKAGNDIELKCIDNCTHRTIVSELHSSRTEAARVVLDFIQKCTANGSARR